MVIFPRQGSVTPERRRGRGARQAYLILDLAIAMTLLIVAVLPLAFSFNHERKLARAYYHRAIAMEIVDGEFETLMAGEWKKFSEGRHAYPVTLGAVTNLPSGEFILTREGTNIRLEWIPATRGKGGRVRREAGL